MGVLNKKFWQVPDGKPYRDYTTYVIVAVVCFLGVILTLALPRCSVERKVAKVYRDAEIYNPITTEDSLHLLRASKKVRKDVPPKIIPGKTVKQTVFKDKIIKELDSALISNITDSLIAVSLNQADTYNNNIDELIRDCDKAVKKALQLGYKEAMDSIGNIQLPNDTIPNCDEIELELSDCNLNLGIAQRSLISTEAKLSTYRLLFFVFMGAMIAGILIAIFVKRSKYKLPSA